MVVRCQCKTEHDCANDGEGNRLMSVRFGGHIKYK